MVWRVGRQSDPLAPPPRERCSWRGRFDDAARRFRTLYCAASPDTSLREKLAPLRPSAEMWMELLFSLHVGQFRPREMYAMELGQLAGLVLASAEVDLPDNLGLVDIEDLAVRTDLEREYAWLLATHGVSHLDISELRSDLRPLTQTLAGELYNKGYAGISYRSKVDNERCYALFEGRYELRPTAEPVSLTERVDWVERICREMGLQLDR